MYVYTYCIKAFPEVYRFVAKNFVSCFTWCFSNKASSTYIYIYTYVELAGYTRELLSSVFLPWSFKQPYLPYPPPKAGWKNSLFELYIHHSNQDISHLMESFICHIPTWNHATLEKAHPGWPFFVEAIFLPTKTPDPSCDFDATQTDLWSIKHVQLPNGFAGLQIWQKVSWSTTLRRPWSFASSQEKDSPNTEPSMGGDPIHHQACLLYDVLESQTLWHPKTISRLLIPCFGETLIQLQRDIFIRLIIQFPFQFSSLPCKICCGPQHL